MALYAGTSGFAYKEWKGTFYPERLPDRQMLAHYSRELRTVEINYTFRRMPSEEVVARWRGEAAEGFRFTLKAPQRITHFKRLRDTGEDVTEFCRRARLLGDRLGCILFQLPPNFPFDQAVLGSFLGSLPQGGVFAMEFRHPSWSDPAVQGLLVESGVAICGADTDESSLGSVPLTAPHAYLRLRKQGYSGDDVALWAERLRPVLASGNDIYCYFKHEEGAMSARLAASLTDAVEGRHRPRVN